MIELFEKGGLHLAIAPVGANYSRTSMARTLMAGLPWLFRTLFLESLGKKSYSCRLGLI